MKLVDFWVPGRPRTKGSYTPMVACAKHNISDCRVCTLSMGVRTYLSSTPEMEKWQREIAISARARYRTGSGSFGHNAPWPGPVRVTAVFFYAQPARGATEPFPTLAGYGDIDKLLRTLLDALTMAGVIADDRLVQGAPGLDKRWALPGEPGGVLCEVHSIDEAR